MARAVFWIILCLGLGAMVATAYLRFELAQPGVSGLTTALAGDAPGDLLQSCAFCMVWRRLP